MTATIESKLDKSTKSTESNTIDLSSPSVVKLPFKSKDVAGYDRSGSDMIVKLKSGETIHIKNFYVVKDGQESELVLQDEDGGLLWVGLGALGLGGLGAMAAAGSGSDKDKDKSGDGDITNPVVKVLDDSGKDVTGKETNDPTPRIEGTGKPGEKVTITDKDGKEVGTAVVDDKGTWVVKVADDKKLPEGPNELTVTKKDPAGNEVTTKVKTTIDLTPPADPNARLKDDSGTDVTGKETNDPTPTVTGTGTPGDKVTVTGPDGKLIGTAVVDAKGVWEVKVPEDRKLPEGPNTLKVQMEDSAGNKTATEVKTTVDLSAPSDPNARLTDDSGKDVTGKETNDPTPRIEGTGKPGEKVTVTDKDGKLIGTAVVDDKGTWVVKVADDKKLPEGPNELKVKKEDPAGNEVTTKVKVTIDLTPPADPNARLKDDSGKDITGKETNDPTPTVTGTGKPGDKVTVTGPDGKLIGTAVVDAKGVWEVKVPEDRKLPEGPNTLKVTVEDPAGNKTATEVKTTVDLSAPTDPNARLTDDSGKDVTGKETNDPTPTIQGTGKPGENVTVTDKDGNEIGTAVVDDKGVWELKIPDNKKLPEGPTELIVTNEDPAGNKVTTKVTTTIDLKPPADPNARLKDDSGKDITDKETNDATPTVAGTGTPGDKVTVTGPDGKLIGTAVVDAKGVWEVKVPEDRKLPEGPNTLKVTVEDPAGNKTATEVKTTVDLGGGIDTTVGARSDQFDAGIDVKKETAAPETLFKYSWLIDLIGLFKPKGSGDFSVGENTTRDLTVDIKFGAVVGALVQFKFELQKQNADKTWSTIYVEGDSELLQLLGGGKLTREFKDLEPGNYRINVTNTSVASVLGSMTVDVTFTTEYPDEIEGTKAAKGNIFDDNGEGADTRPSDVKLLIRDANGNEIEVPKDGSAAVQGKYGVLTIKSDGSFTYEPNKDAGSIGQKEEFTYKLVNSKGEEDTATLTINIRDADDVKAASDKAAAREEQAEDEPAQDAAAPGEPARNEVAQDDADSDVVPMRELADQKPADQQSAPPKFDIIELQDADDGLDGLLAGLRPAADSQPVQISTAPESVASGGDVTADYLVSSLIDYPKDDLSGGASTV